MNKPMFCDNFKNNKCVLNIVLFTLWLTLLGVLVHYINEKIDESERLVDEIEYKDSLNQYHKIYYETEFKSLKKTNKELYDSLKKYKDKVSYLIQFSYEKGYSTGKVITKTDTVYRDSLLIAKTYEYTNSATDSFEYNLQINSNTEPNWYALKAKFKEKFTLVNQDNGNGQNHITIGGQNGGNISGVTAFKKENEKSFWDRFSIGPSVTAGYDPINKQWGVMVGFGGTFDLK